MGYLTASGSGWWADHLGHVLKTGAVYTVYLVRTSGEKRIFVSHALQNSMRIKSQILDYKQRSGIFE